MFVCCFRRALSLGRRRRRGRGLSGVLRFRASSPSLDLDGLFRGWANGGMALGRSHIFYSKRVVEIPDGKPKWAGMDEASELLDDYGNVKPED